MRAPSREDIMCRLEKGNSGMRAQRFMPIVAALAVLCPAFTAVAQDQLPSIEMTSSSVNVGIGGQSGSGVLRLPNLGTNCAYPFTVSGFGAGIRVGVSRASAVGVVANMKRVSDLAGSYSATEGEATLIAGAGSTSMKNQGNDVMIGLRSRTEGLALGFGGQGMTIQLAAPVLNAQRSYYLTFGFGKDHIGAEGRAVLNQVVRDWKCRYAMIRLYGNSDTVGKENPNLDLSAGRAIAARNYLIRAGVAPNRLYTAEKGESSPMVATDNNTRLRSNRNVLVVIEE
jgi:outer membrane protein OmpA-like peptidoglycan-associated protein